jgi:hypothetical protein
MGKIVVRCLVALLYCLLLHMIYKLLFLVSNKNFLNLMTSTHFWSCTAYILVFTIPCRSCFVNLLVCLSVVCLSVCRLSVRPSVRPSVCLKVQTEQKISNKILKTETKIK